MTSGETLLECGLFDGTIQNIIREVLAGQLEPFKPYNAIKL